MEDLHNSSAYSSLTNSMTEIHIDDNKSSMNKNSSTPDSKNTSAYINQMRSITEDYNVLLKKATKEIKSLTAEKFELQEQCEKLLTVNEDLTQELTKLLKEDGNRKKEHEAILKANSELFDETQRLTDEEEKWTEQKEHFESEISLLRTQIVTIEKKVRDKTEDSSKEKLAIDQLKSENTKYQDEMRNLQDINSQLESKFSSLKFQIKSLHDEKDTVLKSKERISGENMQLMLDVEDQAKQFQQKIIKLQSQLQKSQDRCKELERENMSMATIPPNDNLSLTERQQKEFESLIEKNKNLTEWREQLIGKIKVLQDENHVLKLKCQNLEDLLNEEETDIGDVLELIKKVQVPSTSPNGQTNPIIGPISKFRDHRF